MPHAGKRGRIGGLGKRRRRSADGAPGRGRAQGRCGASRRGVWRQTPSQRTYPKSFRGRMGEAGAGVKPAPAINIRSSGRKGRIIGKAFGARRVERREIERVEIGARTETIDEIGIADEATAKGNRVRLA